MTIVADDRKSHILPVTMNDLTNTIAASRGLGSIEFTTQPFRRLKPPKKINVDIGAGDIFGALCLGFVYVLFILSCATEFIYDRVVRAKNQLRVNGLGFYMYFGSFYAVTFASMLVIYITVLATSQGFQLHLITIPPGVVTLSNSKFILLFKIAISLAS